MSSSQKTPLIIIAGPTASGKTGVSLALAKELPLEIISADSMQVYQGMDIGSAKASPLERSGVPHHLLDIISPFDEWNVMLFCREAQKAIQEIRLKDKLPVVVGGTGFYIHALAYGASFEEEAPLDPIEAERLSALDSKALHQYLAELDPVSAVEISPQNRKRVMRAITYTLSQKEPFSTMNQRQREKESPYELHYFVLNLPRPVLYERIDERVYQMIEDGLEEEVRSLRERGCHSGMVSMKGIGYKEMLDYLEGSCSLEEAIYQMKIGTRHFAKRQLTWFRREKDAVFLDITPEESAAKIARRIRAML